MSFLILLLITFLLVALVLLLTSTHRRKVDSGIKTVESTSNHGVEILQTQIIRCKISHSRLFPVKHQFIYSYLSVGMPVRTPNSNWLLSIDVQNWWRRGWLHVTGNDHLHRLSHETTVLDKLNHYLRQQAIDPESFTIVYLLTCPRIFGYMFSPASFWYLYTPGYRLKYIIAEVNNTFGERRMYLFLATESSRKFSSILSKDFHVSPFNSRKGSYILTTTDPLESGKISVTITLLSSKGHPKLVARWWSIDQSINPDAHSIHRSLWFLLIWGWTVLVTLFRIVLQAIVLAQLHGLGIWYRPEPRETAEPRQTTPNERIIASMVMRYIQRLLFERPEHIHFSVRSDMFQAPFGPCEACDGSTPVRWGLPRPALELRVHAPQFYRQVISYNSLVDCLRYILLEASEENRTAWSNDSVRVIGYLDSFGSMTGSENEKTHHTSFSRIIWAAFRYLRATEPLKGAYPASGSSRARVELLGKPDDKAKMKSQTQQYFLDEFVAKNCAAGLQIRYMWAALSLQWRTKIMGLIGGE